MRHSFSSNIKKLSPIWFLLLINILIGFLILPAYGDSWDEFKFYKYANLSLRSLEWLQTGELPTFGNTYDNYGPVYAAGVTLITRLFANVGDERLISQVRHLVVFLTFQGGVYAFYQLSRRWLGGWAAFGATLLFSTQPLFWGHAFISLKDIPVMAFFLLSVHLGLVMVDKVFENDGVQFKFERDWQPLTPKYKQNFAIVTTLFTLLFGALIFGTGLFQTSFSNLINSFYTTGQPNIFSKLFIAVAEDAFSASADVYIHKGMVFFRQGRFFILLLSPLFLFSLYYRKFRPIFKLFSWPVLIAGVVLGLATSIRILSPLAGVLVAGYVFSKVGKRSLPVLVIYGLIASYVLYFTWPYLWPEPWGHLSESILVMSQYPWLGEVLFNGTYYPSTGLPWTFLPVVLAIQMTEPVWILLIMGIIGIWLQRSRIESKSLIGLSLGWFLIPVIGLILIQAPVYDNSRQIFFLLPPIFLLAGWGLEWAFTKVSQPFFRTLIIAGIALPGLVAGVGLHPYQYIYYNSFVGGVSGAERRFELDYWGLAYFEAAQYLNQVAPPNARVWAAGPSHLLPIRLDMEIYSFDQKFRAESYDYVVALSRYDHDQTTFPESEILHVISRDSARLAVIKGVTQTAEP
jgi:hypothetical protein